MYISHKNWQKARIVSSCIKLPSTVWSLKEKFLYSFLAKGKNVFVLLSSEIMIQWILPYFCICDYRQVYTTAVVEREKK